MQIEIVEVNSKGAGYAVVYTDDGGSYGLQFHGAPVDSPTALLDHLSKKIAEHEARLAPAAPVVVPVAVRGLIRQRTAITRPLRTQE